VRKAPTIQEITQADLQTKTKYFLYMLLPDITLDANGFLKVKTVDIQDPNTGQTRPATFVDVMNFHVQILEQDYKDLIEKLKSVITYDMSYTDALSASKDYFDEFERKYGIGVDDMAPTLILLLKMRDYFQRGMNGEITTESLAEYKIDLDTLDAALYGDIKRSFIDKALDRLKMSLNEDFVRLKQAEDMRKSVGSGTIPGDSDGCFDTSSGST
jgi:hypothetical protein